MSSDTKNKILEILKSFTKEMEGYSYFGSNPGISADDYEDVADKIVVQLEAELAEYKNVPGFIKESEKASDYIELYLKLQKAEAQLAIAMDALRQLKDKGSSYAKLIVNEALKQVEELK